MEETLERTNFIWEAIDQDLESGRYQQIHTRFPPEPNGYLHIGSAKAIYINWSIANQYGGKFNLRLDDTNPAREGEEYVNSIIEDLHWLGADPNGGIFYGSDYFDQCYEYAEKLIKEGKAYVDDLSREEMREYRGADDGKPIRLSDLKKEKDWLKVRGHEIAMIMQDPMTSLNPLKTIGDQIMEAVELHQHLKGKAAREKTLEYLRDVGIADPEVRFAQYPHEFSGGMRQRVVIAIAVACNPQILICDEPTTALDVTIQEQIMDLLAEIIEKTSTAIILITHDLGVIAEMADYVVVMYAGRIVEQGTAEEIFAHPAHPYTIGLMASKPVVGRQVDKLYSIPGKVPNPINMPNYCYFKDRCEMCVNGCEGDYPCEVSISPTHKVSCYRYYDGKRPDLEEVVEEELAEGKENGKEGE